MCFKRYKHIFEVLAMYTVREALIGKYIITFLKKGKEGKGKENKN